MFYPFLTVIKMFFVKTGNLEEKWMISLCTIVRLIYFISRYPEENS